MFKITTRFAAVLAMIAWSGCRANREEPPDSNITIDDDFTDGQTDDGTDDGTGDGGTTPEQGVAQLSRFESEQELEDYFKGQITAYNSQYTDYWRGDDFDAGEEAEEPTAGAEGEGEGEGEGELPDSAPVTPGDDSAGDAGGGGDGEQGADHSDTTIQEEGVDEADVVKTDGEYIYVMCGEELRIVRATPAADLALVSTFDLEGWGQDLYLVGDLAVALTQSSGVFMPMGIDIVAVEGEADDTGAEDSGDDSGTNGDAVPPPDDDGTTEPDIVVDEPMIAPWFQYRPQSIVTVIDVSDRSAPVQRARTVFDGNIAASRMIDGVLRLVLSNYADYYYDILPLGAEEEELGLADLDIDALLPDYETTDDAGQSVRGNIVEWDGFFRPGDPDGFGVTTVVTLDTATPDTFDAVAVLAEPGLIYASTQALYLTDTNWYYDFQRTDTDVYKFAFLEGTVALVAAGTVPGRILNQYSMGEYEGYLRVATTTDGLFIWETGEEIPSSNGVYVLGENAGELAIVGQIEDLGVTETIQSARFIGQRGYVVTFRQIDPLFTLDLADPLNPQVVGELKVPGYSTFLVPMDADHLLTIGVYVPEEGPTWGQGVQLSVFDVSNFAQPTLMHNVVIGDESTYSEATWNPKAFTYFPEQNLVALPVEHWGWMGTDGGTNGFATDGFGTTGFGTDGISVDSDEVAPAETRQAGGEPVTEGEDFRGILVYGVTVDTGFNYLGRVSTVPEGQDYWWSSFTRGVFIGEHVYAVTDLMVATAAVADLDTVVATVELFDPDDYPWPVYPEEPVEPEPAPDDGEGDSGSSDSGGSAEAL